MSNDTRLLDADPASLFIDSLDYYSLIIGNIPFYESTHRLLERTPFIPPLSELTPSFFYYFFGKSPHTAIMSNSLYIIILILSVYGIGKHIYNKKVGILAAFITITMPCAFALSRTYGADFPMAAMAMLSLFLLLKSNNFTNQKYSLLFGIAAGLSFLTKLTYVIYFITMITLHFLSNLKMPKCEQIKNMALAIILLFVIAAPWYVLNGKTILTESLFVLQGGLGNNFDASTPDFLTIGQVYKTLTGLVQNQDYTYFIRTIFDLMKVRVSFFYTALFFLALCCIFFRKKEKADIMLLGLIFIPCASWLIVNQSVGIPIHIYILPSMIIISLFIPTFLLTSNIKKYSSYLIALLIMVGILQFILISYLTGIRDVSSSPIIEKEGVYTIQKQEAWKLDKLFDSINLQKDKETRVMFLPASPTTHIKFLAALKYMAQLHGTLIRPISPIDDFQTYRLPNNSDYKELILESDYIVMCKEKSKGQLMQGTRLKVQSQLIKEFNENRDKFELSKQFTEGGNLTFYVYKKIV